jgi:hypothetical protein
MRPLGNIIEQHSIKYKCYADDIQLYHSFPPVMHELAKEKLESCVRDIRQWLLYNLLSLNSAKSELIVCGTRQQLSKIPNFAVRVGDNVLLRKASVRDLGVEIDEFMSFQLQVNMICRKAYFYLRTISRLRNSLMTEHAAMLVHALVLSRLDYCCSLLSGIMKKLETKIQRVINAAWRVVHKGDRRSLNEWLNASQRIQMRIATIVRLSLEGKCPSFICDLFVERTSQRALRSNSDLLLVTRTCRTEMGRRAFGLKAAELWNSLPNDVKSMKSITAFKSAVNQHLLAE